MLTSAVPVDTGTCLGTATGSCYCHRVVGLSSSARSGARCPHFHSSWFSIEMPVTPPGRRGHVFFESAQTRPKSPFGGPLGSQKTRSEVIGADSGVAAAQAGSSMLLKNPHRWYSCPWAVGYRPMAPHCPSCACSLCAGGPRGSLVVYAGARDLKCASFSVCLCAFVQLHSIMGLRRVLQDLRRRSHRSFHRRRPRPRPRPRPRRRPRPRPRRCYRCPRIHRRSPPCRSRPRIHQARALAERERGTE